MPLPRVTKPDMSSGGAGLQHCANCVIKSSNPTTSTPLLLAASFCTEVRTKCCSSITAFCTKAFWVMFLLVSFAPLKCTSKSRPVNTSRAKAMYKSSVFSKPKAWATSSCLLAVFERRCNSFSNNARPVLMLVCVSCALNHARILLLVRLLAVYSSRNQSRDGPPCLATVICTVCPVCKGVLSGTMWSLTFAPRQRCPTLVCT